jgi:hypothetical protein
MAKLIIKDAGHFIAAIEKAIEIGKLDNLLGEIKWLAGDPEDWKTEVELFPELNFGAPPSFGFVQRHLAKDGYTWSNGVSGGVIFHSADQSWSTHT